MDLLDHISPIITNYENSSKMNEAKPYATSPVLVDSTTTSSSEIQRRITQKFFSEPKSTNSSFENNKNLHKMLLAGDVMVACGVSFGITPFMVIIDKAIVQRAAGTHTILRSSAESFSSMIYNPYRIVKSPTFLMMWTVYAATYSTVNSCKTILKYRKQQSRDIEERRRSSSFSSETHTTDSTANMSVFLGTTAVNSLTTMWKDKYYAMQFGVTKAVANNKVPLITYGLWGIRDCMAIGSSFILPDIMSSILQKQTNLNHDTSLRISQFTCPILSQLVITPVQVLGLDFYNRPLASMMDRIRFQLANYTSIVGARISRVAPAYGIGGIGNTYLRNQWRIFCQRRKERNTTTTTSIPPYFTTTSVK